MFEYFSQNFMTIRNVHTLKRSALFTQEVFEIKFGWMVLTKETMIVPITLLLGDCLLPLEFHKDPNINHRQ